MLILIIEELNNVFNLPLKLLQFIIIRKSSAIKLRPTNAMKDLSSSQLQLFAKLSKILANTFQDIHRMCLQQSQNDVNGKNVITNNLDQKQWMERRDQFQYKHAINQMNNINNIDDEYSKILKQKKTKFKVIDYHQDSSNKEKKEKKKKIAKWQQQGKPRPPLNSFMLFLRDSKFQIMEAKPQLTPSQVSSYASALWNDLTEQQKEKYKNQYRENKIKYDQSLKEYQQKQKLSGKICPKPIKRPTEKNEKDILDRDILNHHESEISSSNSGI